MVLYTLYVGILISLNIYIYLFGLFLDAQVDVKLDPKISSDIMHSQIPPLCYQLFGFSRPTGSKLLVCPSLRFSKGDLLQGWPLCLAFRSHSSKVYNLSASCWHYNCNWT